jgi:hypothetical protein
LQELFDLEYVASAFPLQGQDYKAETLAFDKQSGAFVIIEYKKGTDPFMFGQGLSGLLAIDSKVFELTCASALS